jgi:hypothetical protein
VSQRCLEKQPLVLAELLQFVADRWWTAGGLLEIGEEKIPNIAPLNRQGKAGLTMIELWEIGEENK